MRTNLTISKMYEKLYTSLNELNGNVQKDKELFIFFGVTKERMDLFQRKIRKYGISVQDDFTEISLKEKNAKRILSRKILREKIRVVLSSMFFAWPESHPMSKFYELSDLCRMNDFELANTGRIILLLAHRHREVLKDFGLTDEQLYELSTEIARLTVAHTETVVLKKELVIRDALLKQFASELIREAKVYAKIGRAIWVERAKDQCLRYRVPYKIYKKILEPDVGYSLISNPY